MKWKVLKSEYLHNEPWLTIRKDKCEMPDGTLIPSFYIQEYPEWVNALGLTKEGKVVIVKQYRHGLEEISIELPGGVAEEGETMEEAVIREFIEETGYEFEEWKYLGKICANPSTTNNYMHMFLATGGEKLHDIKLDDAEDVETFIMDLEEVKNLVKENKIVQSLHVNCILYALLHLKEASL